MAKIQIAIFVDVEVEEENGSSWDALYEGFEIIEKTLKTNSKIGEVYHEGISKIIE